MDNNKKDKIQRLLALANDANDEESRTALAKAQQLMVEYKVSEEEINEYTQQQSNDVVIDHIIISGKPHKWVYRLARIIAYNFRVSFYYSTSHISELHFVGLDTDVKIAEISFQYAKGAISYFSNKFLQRPEIKRKRKRKWTLKQDYIQGYLRALQTIFKKQVLTNGYELALQLPESVKEKVQLLGLVPGKDTSHKISDIDSYNSGYSDGMKFRQRELIN